MRGKVLPMSLLGCETCPVNEDVLSKLRTAFANALAFSTCKRSVDLPFSVASYGEDLEPDIEIVNRRASVFRRGINKNNETARLLQENLDIYSAQQVAGTFVKADELNRKTLG